MKIGLICSYHLRFPGGVQKQTLEWSRQLESLGHECVILTCGPEVGNQVDNVVFLGGHVPFRTNGDITVLSGYLNSRNRLRNFLKDEKFDLLHFHEPFSPFLSWQLLKASESVNVCTFHTLPNSNPIYRILDRPIKSILLSPLVEKITGFSAVSQSATETWKDIACDIDIIPNAIDLSIYKGQKHIERYSDGKINILYVGRLTRRKGIFHLIEAVATLSRRYSNLRLIIVGDGPLKKKVLRTIGKTGLKNIKLEGFVSDKELPAYYATADIYCSPAIHGESFGIVLLEAMANGLPVVAFANNGYKNVLKDKPFCDFLAKPEDTDGLIHLLEKLICNRPLREELGKSGLSEVQRYSWEKIGLKIMKFYENALR